MGKRARLDRRAGTTVPAVNQPVEPLAARRLDPRAREVYGQVATAGQSLAELEDEIRDLVVPRARAAGLSWSLIGAALGITGEGARRRYGAPSQQ